MQLQPLVRILLTALAAGLGAAAATIDNETVRIVAAIGVPVLAAIGIIPPQVPTRTVVDERREGGQAYISLIIGVLLILILVVVLLRLV